MDEQSHLINTLVCLANSTYRHRKPDRSPAWILSLVWFPGRDVHPCSSGTYRTYPPLQRCGPAGTHLGCGGQSILGRGQKRGH